MFFCRNGHPSHREPVLKNATIVICYSLLIATFALWFGGFTFYVTFVVPIGTEVLGSARSQGFITQQVTNWLNFTCGCAIGIMWLESLFCWKLTDRPWREIRLIMVLIMSGFLVVLVWLHPRMDQMLVFDGEVVKDREKFYGIHRIYLWVSTFQWVAAWIWLFVSVHVWKRIFQVNASKIG